MLYSILSRNFAKKLSMILATRFFHILYLYYRNPSKKSETQHLFLLGCYFHVKQQILKSSIGNQDVGNFLLEILIENIPQFDLIIEQLMLLRSLKNLIKKNDLFYSNEMLRYENQLEYKSLTGGIISLALIVTILVGFANMIILTLQREQISSSKTVSKYSDPTFMSVNMSPENKFMIGFQIQGVNLSADIRFFDIKFMKVTRNGGEITEILQVPYEKCTKQHWAELPEVINNFDTLGVQNWICPQINYNLDIQGKYSSNKYIQYVFVVKQCRNSSSHSACASEEDITALFQEASNQFFLTVYYMNPIINENKRDYVSYYLQDSNYVIFGDKIGSEAYFYFTDYTVSTDESIWPFDSIVEQKGGLIQNFWSMPFQIQSDGYYSGIYAYIRLVKSSGSITYDRQVQKISTVFSFVGGMVSAVSAVLFIIKSYNSQAFQIQIASSIFTDSPQREQLKKNNFFTYLRYNVYKFLSFIGFQLNNPNYVLLQSCLEEMGKQLDIKSLIQRIIFLQHCLCFLFEDYQLTSIQLKRPSSCSAIKKVRQQCDQAEIQTCEQLQQTPSSIKSTSEILSGCNFNKQISNQKSENIVLKQLANLNFNMENIFIDDIASDAADNQIRGGNKVADSSLLFKKQRSSLLTLQHNANKGDRISMKIYNHLNEQPKESVFKTRR